MIIKKIRSILGNQVIKGDLSVVANDDEMREIA